MADKELTCLNPFFEYACNLFSPYIGRHRCGLDGLAVERYCTAFQRCITDLTKALGISLGIGLSVVNDLGKDIFI